MNKYLLEQRGQDQQQTEMLLLRMGDSGGTSVGGLEGLTGNGASDQFAKNQLVE